MSNVERIPVTAVAPSDSAGAGASSHERDRRPAAPDPSRYRLIIEEGAEPGVFIYTTLDRLTGEVVRRVPREQVLKLMDQPARAGSVIDTAV